MVVKNIDSNLAIAVRVSFILVLVWGIVFMSGAVHDVCGITLRTLLLLFLSAVVTGLSWLFYFKTLQLGDVSKVTHSDKLSMPLTILLSILLLGESVSLKVVLDGALITAASLVLLL